MSDDDKGTPTNTRAGSSFEIRLGSLQIKAEQAAALIAGLAGLITAISAVYWGLTKTDVESQLTTAAANKHFAEIRESLNTQVSETKARVEQLQAQVRKLTTVPEETQVAAQLGRIDKTVDDVASRLQKLEVVSRWREIRAYNDNACEGSKSQNSHDSLLDLTFLIAATDPKAPTY